MNEKLQSLNGNRQWRKRVVRSEGERKSEGLQGKIEDKLSEDDLENVSAEKWQKERK